MSKLGQPLNQETLVLRRPLTTEKSARQGVYGFEIARDANKALVRAALKQLYSVTPRKVNIVNLTGKKVFIRGKIGRRPGLKKAIVYLKAGEKLNLS